MYKISALLLSYINTLVRPGQLLIDDDDKS